jgi:hypothetical protein
LDDRVTVTGAAYRIQRNNVFVSAGGYVGQPRFFFCQAKYHL